jgi:hypothetical protein
MREGFIRRGLRGRNKIVYKEYPLIGQVIKENAIIWRYMDFTKFVSLLDRSALFFCRVDKMDDLFEGAHSLANMKIRKSTYSDTKIPLEKISSTYESLRKYTAINCWYLNNHESAAMWKVALKSNEGIAIRSTYKCLKECFIDTKRDVFIGKVKYADYKKDVISEDPLVSFLYKRKGFQHEKELRTLIQNRHENGFQVTFRPAFQDGEYVKIALDTLVKEIYLAPSCPEWLLHLVTSVIKKYGLNKTVVQSKLDEKPKY